MTTPGSSTERSSTSILSDIRTALCGITDNERTVHDALTILSLSTVMGSSCSTGQIKHKERMATMLANVDLKDALVGCLDKDKALRTMSNISKKLVDDRLTLVLAHATAVLDMHVNAIVIPAHARTHKAVKDLLEMVHNLSGASAAPSVSPARAKAELDFIKSSQVVGDAVKQIRLTKDQLDQVNNKLTIKFDESDLLSTANDTSREKLVELRTQLEKQREYAERRMLDHFDETARARSFDSRPIARDLVIPEDLILKARGPELIISVNDTMRTMINQFYALAPSVYRIGVDFNPADGTYWRPPCCFTDYVDVNADFREEYRVQNLALAAKFKSKYGEAALSIVYSTNKSGNNNQYDMKAHQDDGVMIYYCLLTMSTPSSSAYRDDIDQDISRAPDLFMSGDPTKRIAKLTKTIQEAKRLGIKMRWSYGKKIITHLSSRHNTFAVKLSALESTCPNQDDAADHFDKLCSSVIAACSDIKIASGDNWHHQIANYGGCPSPETVATRDNKHMPLCSYGDKCRFNSPGSTRPCNFRHENPKKGKWKVGLPCVAKGCGGNAPTDQSRGKRELCLTCFRKAVVNGSYIDKKGTRQTVEKAKKKAMAAKKRKRDLKKDKEPFNQAQMQVLSLVAQSAQSKSPPDLNVPAIEASQAMMMQLQNPQMHAMQTSARMDPGYQAGDLQAALQSIQPSGPKSTKKGVFQRLVDAVKNSIVDQASALIDQQNKP